MLYSFQKFHTYDFISSPNNFSPPLSSLQAALVAQVVKNLPAVQEMWVPGLGRSAGEGRGNPLQCSCLGESHRQRSLAGYSPWGCKKSVLPIPVTIQWITDSSLAVAAGEAPGPRQPLMPVLLPPAAWRASASAVSPCASCLASPSSPRPSAAPWCGTG